MSKLKHIPQRQCVACGAVRPQRHLVKLIRAADGRVEVDTTWRKRGSRGAYLCPAQECWQLAARRKSVDHALRMTLTPEDWQTLNAYAEGLPAHKYE